MFKGIPIFKFKSSIDTADGFFRSCLGVVLPPSLSFGVSTDGKASWESSSNVSAGWFSGFSCGDLGFNSSGVWRNSLAVIHFLLGANLEL